MRQQASSKDQVNLNLRKEIEYHEGMVREQKDIHHHNYNEILKLKDVSCNLDKEVDGQMNRLRILETEQDNNSQRTISLQGVLDNRQQTIAKHVHKIGECHSMIQEQKYTLNKLDSELGYFENQNEQHQNAQQQLFRANEYEYVMAKDNHLKVNELSVYLSKLEQDEGSLGFEIDRLKQHSEQMYQDQIELQAEVDALDKHMANLNN